MKILIKNGVLVNEGSSAQADIVIENDRIQAIVPASEAPRDDCYDQVVDAAGCLVLPGVIDSHVHFREPGLTHKADVASESRAAAYGGVTSFFDMPNTSPQTTTPEALQAKMQLGADSSSVNYSFFYGATNSNADTFSALDATQIPGIKLFMGSSTGNMLVDAEESLSQVFSEAKRLGLVVMAHCEDSAIIDENMRKAKDMYGADPDVTHHPEIRSAEACYRSTARGVALAAKHGTRFHVAHLTTARELELMNDCADTLTAEATVAHLLFSDADYKPLGTRIKCNPAVKTAADRDELRKALMDGRITTIGTDHAPHLLSEKEGGAAKAVSGMPMLQFSLPAMLTLADEGVLTVERLVELMCHNPARLFNVAERGYLRPGYKADIAIVRKDPWTVTAADIQSKCGWSPLEGSQLNWRVIHTFCNGHHLLNEGAFDASYRGEQIAFVR